MITGRIGYNHKTHRYGFLVMDLWEIEGLHCGDCMEVRINGEWVDTRLEMDTDRKWYFVGTPFHGDLEGVIARIADSGNLRTGSISGIDE